MLLSGSLFISHVFIDIIFASINCYKCLESALIPASEGCNATCTGGFCYRAEKRISLDLNISANESAVLMGCFEFPLEQLKLGCRRNFEGIVLCVCTGYSNTDLCNERESAEVVDLAIVDDCMHGSVHELPIATDRRLQPCRSNYCMYSRAAIDPTLSNAGSTVVKYACQKGDLDLQIPLLARFDILTYDFPHYFPAGTCVSSESDLGHDLELCSCPYINNCSTPTRFAGESGLPLDTRTTGMIACLVNNRSGGFDKCEGHVCFILQRQYMTDKYGCLTYDERTANSQRFRMGAHRVLESKLFVCGSKMCNQRSDVGALFQGLPPNPFKRDDNGTCNCVAPSGFAPTAAAAEAINLSLILGVSIPLAILALLAIALVVFRMVTRRWPLALIGKTRRQRVTVISGVSSDSKTNSKNK